MKKVIPLIVCAIISGIFVSLVWYGILRKEVANSSAMENSIAIHQVVDGLKEDNVSAQPTLISRLCHIKYRLNIQREQLDASIVNDYVEPANEVLDSYLTKVGHTGCEN